MATPVIPEPGLVRGPSTRLSSTIGLVALLASILYFISDVIELAQGGFSTMQLTLTLVAEAAIPFFIVGLYVLQRPRMGRLGLTATVVYAYTFVFFSGTVVFALARRTSNWDVLVHDLGRLIVIHGILMVVAGLALGLAIVRAAILPRWTALTLMAGVVLVAASSGLPSLAQTASAGVRDLAFAAMGVSLFHGSWRTTLSPDPQFVAAVDCQNEGLAS
ncbi:MAG: hypothetical protein QOG21_2263 [Actinomycetota bacterium]|nr:hypothetical protein [Actinomycetota bacterium]